MILPGRDWSNRALLVLAMVASLGLGGVSEAGEGEETRVGFNRDVRPILSEHCNYCHGPDPKHREAELRLDDREVALAKGAIVPGKPEESELIARVFSGDSQEVMPPPETHKDLSAAQKDVLRRWIAEGAEYEPHWAYVAPKRGKVPAVKAAEWIRNPVDAYILKALEAKGVAPSPEADRPTLARRLSLDLVGLPPTPEEVEAFVRDNEPRAFERLVDRLLASPHYGERMAVPWLDLVRFADTVGYHGDQGELTFPYRDYVIDAFNRNLPFDRFTAEQLAGDLLPNATDEQVVASGFNRLNMMTREGGAQPGEYLAKYAADRVRTVSIAFLGSTMGCAECHDHKFDPFKARDFYRMAAFFADLKQWGVYADYGYNHAPELTGMSNDSPFPPFREVASDSLRRRVERLDAAMAKTVADSAAGVVADPTRLGRETTWEAETSAFLRRCPEGWETIPEPLLGDFGPGDVFEHTADARLVVGPVEPAEDLVFRGRPTLVSVAAIRVELLPDAFHDGTILRGGANDSVTTVSATLTPAAGAPAEPLGLSYAEADRKEEWFANGAPVTAVLRGWKTDPGHLKETQRGVWLLDRPLKLSAGGEIAITVHGTGLGCVRMSLSPLALDDPSHPDTVRALATALDVPAGARDAGKAALVARNFLLGEGDDGTAVDRYTHLRTARQECRGARALAQVSGAGEPLVTRVLGRGNWQDQSGEVVSPGVPAFLPQPRVAGERRLNRLDLAHWITSPENPLTARVFVNRLWKQLFGTGLSAVMEDVGAQGEWPSHPELLDWLAVEFRESGWDVKHLVRLMVTSAAYRQQSRTRPELHDLDPNNRLLAFQNPRRLDAEFVRDNALAIAGLLDPEIGGPSAFPYQPPGYYAAIQFPDRDYDADTDERQYRRGVYTHWQRTFLHPMLANFDAPAREECAANRITANSPQQALTLLNDPTFVEAARVLAAEVASAGPLTDAQRIDRVFRKALARPVSAREVASLTAFLDRQRSEGRSDPVAAAKLLHVGQSPSPSDADAVELAAWTELCRVVLNLHETITRY